MTSAMSVAMLLMQGSSRVGDSSAIIALAATWHQRFGSAINHLGSVVFGSSVLSLFLRFRADLHRMRTFAYTRMWSDSGASERGRRPLAQWISQRLIATELSPCSKRPRGAPNWCTDPGVEAEIYAAWQQREEMKRRLRADFSNNDLRKAVKMAGRNLWNFLKASVLNLFWDFVCELETRIRHGDQTGFYKHL